MEGTKCYYKRGGGEIVVARDGKVLRMNNAEIWGHENFKLLPNYPPNVSPFGERAVFLRKFLLGEVGEIYNFWGFDALDEVSFYGSCDFSNQEVENWEDYVLVDGDFWIFLMDKLLRGHFFIYFNSGESKFREFKFEVGGPLANFKKMMDYLKICDDTEERWILRVIAYYGGLMGWR